MPEMNLSRKVLGCLIAARSGHGHYEEEDLHCKCGQRRERRPLTAREILGTAQGVRMFAECAPRTDLFQRERGHGTIEGVCSWFLKGF